MTDDIDVQGDEGRERDVTALVVLRPTATVDAVELVAAEFRRLGFEVGPFLGIAMAVTAPIGHVESTLGVTIPDTAGEVGDEDIELPISALDPTAAAVVARIVIEPPAELHDAPTWSP
ncbi:MAG: hypothetical protein AAGF91_02080 [Actinomycetota bacterium]